MSRDIHHFKLLVEDALASHGVSQALLARKLEFSPDRLNKWLLGQNRIPFDVVGQICDYLRIAPLAQSDLYRLAGYPLPRWVSDRANTEHGDAGVRFPDQQAPKALSAAEFYVNKRSFIYGATHSVCNLTWATEPPRFSESEQNAYSSYLDAIRPACERGVQYREIMALGEDSRLLWARAHHMLTEPIITYSLRYFEATQMRIPPQMHIMVIDRKQVCLGFYRWPHLPVEDEKRLVSYRTEFVHLYLDYFETLWTAAIPLKEGDHVFRDNVDDLANRIVGRE